MSSIAALGSFRECPITDDKKSHLSHEMLLIKTVHNCFISADKRQQLLALGASIEVLRSIENGRVKILGGMDAAISEVGGIAVGIMQALIKRSENEKNNKRKRKVFNFNWPRELKEQVKYKNMHYVSYRADKIEAYLRDIEWERAEEIGGKVHRLVVFRSGYIINNGDADYSDRGFIEKDAEISTVSAPRFALKKVTEKIEWQRLPDDYLRHILPIEPQQPVEPPKAMSAQNVIEASFSKQVSTGFYLLGSCENEVCQLANQPVWTNKFVGSFSVNRECHLISCNFCKKDIENINTVAIRGMSYLWEGQKATEEKKFKKVDSQQSTYDIFFNLSEWKYLKVEVSE